MYKRIRELREDNDYKQTDLAKYLNCTQVSYSRYENGQREVPIETLIKLSDFYNVSIDYILEKSDNPKRN
ncbi:MAG: helix-turn-helix domain-containing protein [Eubacterium sp.]